MSCRQHDHVSAYMDHMMKPQEYARFSQHLQGCPECRRQLDEFTALRQGLRELPSPTLGFDLASRREDRLRAKPRGRRTPRWFGAWSGLVPAGVAAGMALASGVWLGGLLMAGGAANTPSTAMARVFDPVPPGGLCAAAELCRLPKGMP